MKKKNVIFSVIMALCLFCFSGCDIFPTTATTWPTSSESEYSTPVNITATQTLSDIADTLMDSVVTVSVVNKLTSKTTSFGSGVCIYAGGYIVTNYHVVSTYVTAISSYKVVVNVNGSNSSIDAKVLWYNDNFDLAIVQCAQDIPYVSIKDRTIYPTVGSELEILEQVIAIGTPLDFSLQNWTTTGYISKLGTHTVSDGDLYEELIGHSSPINHGNSGGPLFDLNGNVIGLNTLGMDDANSIFFAVPIYPIQLVIDRVVTLNEKQTTETLSTPVMGISCYDGLRGQNSTNPAIKVGEDGVYVESVTEDGASKGKLQTGDIITKVVTNNKTFNIKNEYALTCALVASNIGDDIVVTVKRGDSNISVTIKL